MIKALRHAVLRASKGNRVRVCIRAVVFTCELLEAGGGDHRRREDVLSFIQAVRRRGLLTALTAHDSAAARRLLKGKVRQLFDLVAAADRDPGEILSQCRQRLGENGGQILLASCEPGSASGIRLDLGATDGRPFLPFTIASFSQLEAERLDEWIARNLPYDSWELTQAVLNRPQSGYWESLFALSNGYMGLRGAHEESCGFVDYPAFYVNGVYAYRRYHHELSYPGFPKRMQACLNLFDWRCIDLRLGNECFSLEEGRIHEFRRTLDLAQGILRRRLTWESPGGTILRIRSERLVSMRRRHVAAMRYAVTSINYSGPLTLTAAIHPQRRNLHFDTSRTRVEDPLSRSGHCSATLVTEESDIRIALSARHALRPGGELVMEHEASSELLTCTARSLLSPGSSIVMERYVACIDSLTAPGRALTKRASRESAAAASAGFEVLAAEQRDFWKRFWQRCDIVIKGSALDQVAVRFALFHLRQSYREDGKRSISANGLSGDFYMGNIFWDTEIFMLPFFLFSDPPLARSLLLYRYGILEQARRRAAEMGGPGALYAWHSISGEECAIVPEASTAQYHLNSDIAYAIRSYVDTTGDSEFLKEAGAEILFETARFLFHLGRRIPLRGDRFCLNVVCGPDEYACGVDNNCYTNAMARFHFRYAREVYELLESRYPRALKELAARLHLSRAEVAAWAEAAQRMYIPFVEELGIHAQDDSYLYRNPADMSAIPKHRDIRWDHHPLNLWRLQVSKQADVVLLMYLLGDSFLPNIKKNNYDYYEPRTNHGSSLSVGIHAIVAAEIGYLEQAYAYFRESALLDFNDRKGNTGGGLHSACLGVTWQAVVNGFGGLRVYSDGLQLRPCIPASWQEYGFQVLYRGCRIRLTVTPARVVYELLEGPGLRFSSWGQKMQLGPQQPRLAQQLPGHRPGTGGAGGEGPLELDQKSGTGY